MSAFWSSMLATLAPGDQGAEMTGTQGIGVRVPMAAAVAAATCGFAWVLHMPNGAMFTIGLLSITVAADRASALVGPTGRIVRVEGANPSLHRSFAPFDDQLRHDISPALARYSVRRGDAALLLASSWNLVSKCGSRWKR
ncbi:MAG: hypothetical protein QM820_32455 [Minicystis sp.]